MSKRARYKGEFESPKMMMGIELTVFLWEEGGMHFVYSPAFDLTGYGKSPQEAKDSFNLTLSETLDYMDKKKSLFDELERLGWMVNRRKRKVTAPILDELVSDNEEFFKILSKGAKPSTQAVELAL